MGTRMGTRTLHSITPTNTLNVLSAYVAFGRAQPPPLPLSCGCGQLHLPLLRQRKNRKTENDECTDVGFVNNSTTPCAMYLTWRGMSKEHCPSKQHNESHRIGITSSSKGSDQISQHFNKLLIDCLLATEIYDSRHTCSPNDGNTHYR